MPDRRDPHVFSCESAATPQSLAMTIRREEGHVLLRARKERPA
jgi:hypothetical protein